MKIQFSNGRGKANMTRVFQLLVWAVVLLLVVPSAVRAQVIKASVRGTIMDDQGAAVADAEVTITNVDTGYTRSMKSGSDGAYNFPDLPLGSYRIQAAHPGFKAATQTGIVLHVADSLAINVSLQVGAVSETVTVEASPVAVETTSG